MADHLLSNSAVRCATNRLRCSLLSCQGACWIPVGPGGLARPAVPTVGALLIGAVAAREGSEQLLDHRKGAGEQMRSPAPCGGSGGVVDHAQSPGVLGWEVFGDLRRAVAGDAMTRVDVGLEVQQGCFPTGERIEKRLSAWDTGGDGFLGGVEDLEEFLGHGQLPTGGAVGGGSCAATDDVQPVADEQDLGGEGSHSRVSSTNDVERALS